MRLEGAEVKATTTATRNKNKFKIPDEIRKMATEAVKCENPIQWKKFWKNTESPKGN